MKPLAIDLYCGLGGWAEGLIAEGYDVVGYDIEAHDYGTGGYPGKLVLRDIRTIHGSEFKDATLIVGSSPCQKYSYMAMPWKKAKALEAYYSEPGYPERLTELNELYDAQFRIQREASEAAGKHIPMVVENVRGAQKWVGKASWNYGSFYLWGDVPALMPTRPTGVGVKVSGMDWNGHGTPGYNAQGFSVIAAQRYREDTFGWSKDSPLRRGSSKSDSRKAASAMIAKIPLRLAQHIARAYKPVEA